MTPGAGRPAPAPCSWLRVCPLRITRRPPHSQSKAIRLRSQATRQSYKLPRRRPCADRPPESPPWTCAPHGPPPVTKARFLFLLAAALPPPSEFKQRTRLRCANSFSFEGGLLSFSPERNFISQGFVCVVFRPFRPFALKTKLADRNMKWLG
jgi:hypothetical protein